MPDTPAEKEEYIGQIVIGPNSRTVPCYAAPGYSELEKAAVLSLSQQAIDDAKRKRGALCRS